MYLVGKRGRGWKQLWRKTIKILKRGVEKNIKLPGNFTHPYLMDAHHVLGLGGEEALLHLPPRHGVEVTVGDLQSSVIEALNNKFLEQYNEISGA